MKYISYKKILSKIDIEKGQIVLFNSDILKILVNCKNNGEIFDPNTFLDTIIEKIGKLGTLLLPTYSFDFCAGKTYNYKKRCKFKSKLGLSFFLNKNTYDFIYRK